jgi:hypothetical protein
MRHANKFAHVILVLWALPLSSVMGGGVEISVVSVQPAARVLSAPVDTPVTIAFDKAVDRSTINRDSFWVFAKWSVSTNTRTLTAR